MVRLIQSKILQQNTYLMENNYLLKHWKDQISIFKKKSLKLGIFCQIRHFSKILLLLFGNIWLSVS